MSAADETPASDTPALLRMTLAPDRSVTASGAWTHAVEVAAGGGAAVGMVARSVANSDGVKALVEGIRDVKVERLRQDGATAREQLRQDGLTTREAIQSQSG